MGDKIEKSLECRHVAKLRLLHEEEKRILDSMKYEYSRLPDGSILIPYKNSHATYYVYNKGRQRSVKRSDPLTGRLMRKRVLERAILMQEAWCMSLAEAEESLRYRLGRMKKSGADKTLKRILEMPESDMFVVAPHEYEWKNADYHRNEYRMESLKYRTSEGIMVRSKSEKIIADKLEKYGIPYRYEAEVIIDGRRYYPDFMILLANGEVLIWEHFGLMDDIEYSSKAWRKIENYRQAGFVQHTNLICTYESDIEDDKVIDEIIRRFIL